MTHNLLSLSMVILGLSLSSHGSEIGFIEKFVLASDREKVLAELAPGSEDYYFYHALHYQNTRQADKLADMIEKWSEDRPAESDRRRLIQNREIMLGYDTDPQRTIQFLTESLNLRFEDRQEVLDRKPDLPTVLDQDRIKREIYLTRALLKDDLSGVTNSELERLVAEKAPLRAPQIQQIMDRLQYPDVPGLAELVAQNLKQPQRKSFGNAPLHKALLPDQLDAVSKLVLGLETEEDFVFARIRKLAPGADEDAEYNRAVREAWLERLWGYVQTLPASYNSLKAAVLYQRLEHDRKQGIYDQARFLEYLKLPHDSTRIPLKLVQSWQGTQTWKVDIHADYRPHGVDVPNIGNDEELVRDYFLRLFAKQAETTQDEATLLAPYTEWVSVDWMKPLLAEAMVTLAKDAPDRWTSQLTPGAFQFLKDRVDIDFARENQAQFALDQDVSIDLYLKNVPKLMVRIYEMNTLGWFLKEQRELNTDVNLDGLVAQSEKVHEYTDPPLHRLRRTFTFPELKGKRGAWVVEFIGGGRSSRALLRSGAWSLLQTTGPVGHFLTVLDEKHQPVKEAVVWLDGRKFIPGEKSGVIQVPFAENAYNQSAVLASADGSFASLAEFRQAPENYSLEATFYLNREQLLAGRQATLATRVALLNGASQQSLALLKDVKLRLTLVTADGVSTFNEFADLQLGPDRVLTHTFQVPDRLTEVNVSLVGQVNLLSKGGKTLDLHAEQVWHINSIDASERVAQGRFSTFLVDGARSHRFELLGKNGEPVPDRMVTFRLSRRGFAEPLPISLRTDEKGRVQLGALEGMSAVTASSDASDDLSLYLDAVSDRIPQHIQAAAGEVIELPLSKPVQSGQVTLLEGTHGNYVADRTALVKLPQTEDQPQICVIQDLPPGDYILRIKEQDLVIPISITSGSKGLGWIFGEKRHLEQMNLRPLRIESSKAEGEDLVIQLANAGSAARVHVAASRYRPAFSLFRSLGDFSQFSPESVQPAQLPNLYSTGREIGDEYRYILDRRYAKNYAGNMLSRPGLLLQPWEVRVTGQNALRQSGGQDAHLTDGARSMGMAEAKKHKLEAVEGQGNMDSANLDYLAQVAPVRYNLKPDEKGVIRLPLKQLGDRSYIEVYAEDLATASLREVILPEKAVAQRDQRLAASLPVNQPYTETSKTTVLQPGQSLTIKDLSNTRLESYDTLASVFTLYQSLQPGSDLHRFAWVLDWPKLSDDDKRAKYSEFACHELNLFLSRKDPAFFTTVIKPYLANKKEKTFMDDYLLDHDLRPYLTPWKYSQLNAAEQALLGRKLKEDGTRAARSLRERWELLPRDEARLDALYELALAGRGLEALDGPMVEAVPEGTVKPSNGAPAPSKAAPKAGSGLGWLSRSGDSRRAKMPSEVDQQMESAPPPPPAPVAAAAMMPIDPFSEDSSQKFLPGGGAKADADMSSAGGRFGAAYITGDSIDGLLSKEIRPYYRRLGPVKEWAENQYWKRPLAEQGASLIPVNAFWRDYAEWDGQGAFVSPHLLEASHHFAEIMLALAVLDLPFTAAEHEMKLAEPALQFTAKSPVVVFHKEVLPAAPLAEGQQAQQLLVSQGFFRLTDRYQADGNVMAEKYVTKEFLSGVVYGANVVVTNPSNAKAEINLLLQIPQGALPVKGSRETASPRVTLDPYTTETFEYCFYFPQPAVQGGSYTHYPVHATLRGTAAAAAPAFTFTVVSKPTGVDQTSWHYISQYGGEDEVLAYLGTHNLGRVNLSLVAWRCRESVDFFRRLLALLEERHFYQHQLYRYAVYHREVAPLREYLKHQNEWLQKLGPWLQSPLLAIDPTERRSYEHLEYSPLINQRAHLIGGVRRIATPEQLTQYQALLGILSFKSDLDAGDQLSLVYHLFLQDRVEEALHRLKQVNRDALPTKLQYDYLRVYADFYEGDTAHARSVVAQYEQYPVLRWRTLFSEARSQLDEIEGKAATEDGKPDREKAQAALAASEPSFTFKVESQKLRLSWKNLKVVTLNYYLMDPEFAFSSSPFASQGVDRFSILKPNKTVQLTLPEGSNTLEQPLPEEYTRANVMVEVMGAGQSKSQASHANQLKLTVVDNYGRLSVEDRQTDKPLPKTYVKVYARLSNGTIRFFKDGYTDLRGRFDYASLNSPADTGGGVPVAVEPTIPSSGGGSLDFQMLRPGELGLVDKLAILILSDTHGAEVREVAPPNE